MTNLKNKIVIGTLLSIIGVSSLAMPISAAGYSKDVNKSNSMIEYDTNTLISEYDSFYNKDGKLRISKNGYRLFVIDGKLYNWPSNLSDPTPEQIIAMKQEKGKFSFAVKAIRKGYSKLPPKIKGYIAKYLGLDAILGTLDHWTGAIEDGIYRGCKSVGMPDWMAWTVAKALTMIAL